MAGKGRLAGTTLFLQPDEFFGNVKRKPDGAHLAATLFPLPPMSGSRTIAAGMGGLRMVWFRFVLTLVLFLGPLAWLGPVSACPS